MFEQEKSITIEIDASLKPIEPPKGRVSEFFNFNNLITRKFIKWQCSEDYIFTLKSEKDDNYSKNVYDGCCHENSQLDRLYLANPSLREGAAAVDVDKIILTATACPDKRFEAVKMQNVESKFDGISTNGCLQSVHKSEKVGILDSHSQGSNVYIDLNGKRHFIVAHDNQLEKGDLGYLFIFSEPLYEKMEPTTIRPDAGEYNHPGSFQIVGDYLFLPIEHYFPSKVGRKDGSVVFVYDLSPLSENEDPILCCKYKFDKHRAGMLGLTDEWLAIHDDKTTYLYHIDYFDGKNLGLTAYGSQKTKAFQGIGLVQQVDEKQSKNGLYLIGLTHESSKGYKDYIHLFKIEPDTVKRTFSCSECKDRKHVTTDHGRGAGGAYGVHFRYGGGVYLTENAIVCLATGRNFLSDERFHFNTFSNTLRLEINCKEMPLIGQKRRCSQNFSLKGFKGKCSYVDFKIMKNGVPCDDIVINVDKDKAGTDTNVYAEISNKSESKSLKTDSPLYFCLPKPETDDSLIIEITGHE